MANDGVAEVDLSGTSVIAYSSISDTAGGQFFRFANRSDDVATPDVDESLLGVTVRTPGSSGQGFRFDPATHSNLIRPLIPGHPATLCG